MPKRLNHVKVPLGQKLDDALGWLEPGFTTYRILRESVDARRRHDVHKIFSVDVFHDGEIPEDDNFKIESMNSKEHVIVVGAGPAGLFAALRLLERGLRVTLIEQGSVAEKRILGINQFWRYGKLDLRNNVGFGEGGAGLYSDGKLITRTKSPFIPYVMARLVEFGAPKEIRYLANPHVGSDRIRRLIPKMRSRLLQLGATILFDTKVTDFVYKQKFVIGVRLENDEELRAERVILACGHSATGLFRRLYESGVFMEAKPFAVGLRVEHPQKIIDEIQYRSSAGHPDLGAANYKLTYHNHQENYGVYSFCMCPGGYVLSCATENERVVTNGMSNYKRNSPFANSAVVATVEFSGKNPLEGLEYRDQLELSAWQSVSQSATPHAVPAQKLKDFLGRRAGEVLASSSPSGVAPARLDQLLDPLVYTRIVEGFESFFGKMPGLYSDSALLHGVESRTSCPLRITRHEDSLQSLSHSGLYPCGEGAGYAGGITSAACDGIRIAERIATEVSSVSVASK